MNIGFWNIRGVLKKTAVPDIRDFGVQNHICIFMLCEVKSKAPPPSDHGSTLWVPAGGFCSDNGAGRGCMAVMEG